MATTRGNTECGQCSPQLERVAGSGGGRRRAAGANGGVRDVVDRQRLRMRVTRGVLCRAGAAAKPASEQRSSRGVSDPPRLPPIPVPRSERGGSLTPRLRVPAVRTHGPPHASSIRHRAGPRVGRPLVAHRASRRSRPSHQPSSRRGRHAIDQAAHARQAAREASDQARSREQRDVVCVRTLPGRVDPSTS